MKKVTSTIPGAIFTPWMIAWLAVAGSGCTSTYTQAELDADQPGTGAVDAPACSPPFDQPGCQMDDPVCTDPSDFRCLPPDG